MVGRATVAVALNVLLGVGLGHGADCPVWVSSLALGRCDHGVYAAGSFAYVAEAAAGLRILDIRDPAAPQTLSVLDLQATAWDVAVANGFAYVVDLDHGLVLVDVADPAHPAVVDNWQGESGGWERVTVVDTEVFLLADSGLYVLETTGGTLHGPTGEWNGLSGHCGGLAVDRGVVYLVGRDPEDNLSLALLDVSDPSSMVELSSTPLVQHTDFTTCAAIAVAGQYAYVVEDSALLVVDLFDPTYPNVAGRLELSAEPGNLGPWDITLVDTLAYLTHGQDGLVVVDVSGSPTELGRHPTLLATDGLAVARGHAYVADCQISTGNLEVFEECGSSCYFTLSPASVLLGPDGGTGAITLDSSLQACDWSVTSDSSWLHVVGPSQGSGDRTLQYRVDRNQSPPTRTSHLLVVDQVFTVTQSGVSDLDFSWTPESPGIGQLVTFQVTGVGGVEAATWDFGGPGCGGYSQVTTCTPQFGSCSSQAFKFATAGDRTVSLTVVSDGLTYGPVTRSVEVESTGECIGGCSYSTSPSVASFGPAGGTGAVAVEASAAVCVWSATTDDSWLHVTSGASGSGNAEVTYQVEPNQGPARSGTITVAGHDLTVGQGASPQGRAELRLTAQGTAVDPVVALATDRSGNRVVVWSQTPAKSAGQETSGASLSATEGLMARLVDPGDEPVGQVVDVDVAVGGAVTNPTVAFDAEGHFVVGWEKTGGGGGVFARSFGADGAPAGPSFRVDDVGEPGRSPSVAVTAAGDLVMGWRSGQTIRARRLGREGTPRGASVQVDQGLEGATSAPSVACGATGSFAVAWQASTAKADETGTGIFGRFFGPDDAPLGPPVGLEEDPSGSARAPAVAADAAGNVVVTWVEDPSQGAGGEVWARRFDSAGQPSGGARRVSAVSGAWQARPSVAVNPAGDFGVAWESAAATKTREGEDGVFARLFGADGEPVWTDLAVALAEGTVTPSAPAAAVANDDSLTVAYVKTDASGQGEGVYLRTFGVDNPPGSCTAGATTLCLNQDRFQVDLVWRDFEDRVGTGQAVPLTDDTGYFWFFTANNVEVVVKVLDGRGINGFFWVFYGALSNVEYSVTVTDTSTGASVTYFNPMGSFASVGDTEALSGNEKRGECREAETAAAAVDLETAELYTQLVAGRPRAPVDGKLLACTGTQTSLCLNQRRFSVAVSWTDFEGNTGFGQAVPLTLDTGYFWFFNDANVELIVKVLDGTWLNDHYWVFYGALSNVAYSLRVTDTQTGEDRVYRNPSGEFGSVGDTEAFAVP